MSFVDCHGEEHVHPTARSTDMTDTQTESEIFQAPASSTSGATTRPSPTNSPTSTSSSRASIPPELDGWYLRNGPNPRQATGHWFSGDGMIHGIRVEDGRAAWYRNRWVRTDSFRERLPALQRGRHAQPAFGGRQHPRRQPRGQDAGAGRVVAALRGHQRVGDHRRLRLRRQAGRFDDRPPQDLPDDRRDALLRLRQHVRALRHLSPRGRRRRADHQPPRRRQGA